jgi:hypothetical protein
MVAAAGSNIAGQMLCMVSVGDVEKRLINIVIGIFKKS